MHVIKICIMLKKLLINSYLVQIGLAGYNQVPVYNIADFGAVGDGITNNTAAIQKTIDDGGTGYFQISRNGEKITTTRNTNYLDLNVIKGKSYTYSEQTRRLECTQRL